MTSQTSGTGREPARSCAECGTRAEPGQSFCDSCGSVLGWSGGPDRPDTARTEPVRAEAAAPARGAAPGGAGGAPVPAAGGPSREGAGDRPGWDAFARPGAGTGTARTGHAPASGGAGAAAAGGGRQAGDEAGWRHDGADGPVTVDRPERDTPHRRDEGAPGTGAGAGRAGNAPAGTGPFDATRRPETGASSGTWPPDTAGDPRSDAGTRHPHSDPGAGSSSGSGAAAGTWRRSPDPDVATDPRRPDTGHGSAETGPSRAAAPGSDSASGSAGSGAGSFRQGPVTGGAARWDADPDTHSPGRADSARRDGTAGTDPVPSAAERARSLLVPVSDPEPRTPETPAVAPVLPGRPVAQRPQVRAPGPEAGLVGGIPCPWCATPNHPDRHYCGRCAMPMAGGGQDPTGRQPWWRRLPGFRAEQNPWAGDRPRLRRGFGPVMNWIVGGLVLALIVTLVLNVGGWVDATRDHFAKRAAVGPTSVKASRSFSGHGAQFAFDKLSNTWWGPGVSQSGEGEWIQADFEQPTRLLDLVITSGVSTKVNKLQESALPRRIEAQITKADGEKSTRTITLDQSAGGQRRKFRVGEVVSVRFILRSAYAADRKKQVSIAEIEFFGRSNANTS